MLVKVENSVSPMPMMTESTITLMPEDTTLPRTRSARNEVLFHRAKGISVKPANVVSLNSRMVMKSCTARRKKLMMTMNQASTRTMMMTRCVKTLVKPIKDPACCKSGQAAVKPVPANLPGRCKSAAVSPVAVAFSPSVVNELKMIVERLWKFSMM